ncbi:helix-turn-helix domain-containing protein [Vagococcus fluvialis]|uniref:helix-turn-helix domain-containing protein n=1 Tax=Vagococcus fluvialis TaxID=2738 RepID=UPI0037AA3C3E
MTDLNSDVIKQIKKLRIGKKISQEKLSELSGLDPKYINKLENGRFNLTVPTLERILKGLSLPNDRFFELLIDEDSGEINELNDLLNSIEIEKRKIVIESIKKIIITLDE